MERHPDFENLNITGQLRHGVDIEIRVGTRSIRLLAVHLKSYRFENRLPEPCIEGNHCEKLASRVRYTVHDRHGRLLALLGFSTAARTLAPRDRFIGWTPALRQKNLPLVIDNARFLILPWIRIPNLASHILSVVCRQLPGQWTERYNTSPVLIETFVETPRFTGATYKASGWVNVGTTQGRGRYDRYKQYDKPKKDIWLRPLRKDWQRTLNR